MENETTLRQKADAFDRLVLLYRELEKGAGFASSSWVIFSEALDNELKRIEENDPK